MLYPLPVAMVSLGDGQGGSNIITIAWVGTVCTNPPMVSVSVRPERHSYPMLRATGEFVVNLATEELARAADFCGVKSGRDVDKFKILGLTRGQAVKVSAPVIQESPVNIECKVVEIKELGSHHMFLAEVVAVQVDDAYIAQDQRFQLEQAHPLAYSHGEYFGLGRKLGKFGYSIEKHANHQKQKGQRRHER